MCVGADYCSMTSLWGKQFQLKKLKNAPVVISVNYFVHVLYVPKDNEVAMSNHYCNAISSFCTNYSTDGFLIKVCDTGREASQ